MPDDTATIPPTDPGATCPPQPADESATISPADPNVTAAQPATAIAAANGLPSIPGFEFLGVLGRGGMGVVYHARQVALNREVALKMVLAGEHAGAAERVRFLTEAEAVAALHHPGVVQVYEFGTHAGLPYFALEYCPGGSLAARLNGTPLPVTESAAIVEKLARAVQAAHEKGIVHRDLKPANVLLDSAGSPKVTDFGLAKRVEGGSGLTQTGTILGTPSYMAPEQAAGEGKAVGPAADTYALGAILYECLTGRPPFKAATPLDTVIQVATEEPVPLRRLNPQAPADLETICHKCLQKDVNKRYTSAAELADDLGHWQRGEPIAARPVGQVERGWRWCRRNPAVAWSGLAVAVALVFGTVISLNYAIVANAEAKRAGDAEQAAKDRADAETVAKQEADRERARTRRDFALQGVGLALADWRAGVVNRLDALLNACPPEERGWDWRYVRALAHASLATWREPDAKWDGSAWINGMAYTPDGTKLVTMSRDGKLRVRDARTGQLVRTIATYTGPTGIDNGSLERLGVAIFPDGKRVVAPAANDAVGVWELDTGEPGLTIKCGNGFSPLAVAVSPDGKRLAVGGRGQYVKVIDADTGKQLADMAFPAWVLGLAFTPDGERVAVAAGPVKLWNVSNGRTVVCRGGLAMAVAVSPDGRWVASAGRDGEVRVWHTSDGRMAANIPGAHSFYCHDVAFSPDGRRLATCGWLGSVKLWEVDTWREIASLPAHQSTVSGLAFRPDGLELATGDYGGELRVWDGLGEVERRLVRHADDGQVTGLAVNPAGDRVVIAKYGTIYVWNESTGFSSVVMKLPASTVDGGLDYHPGSNRIAAGDVLGGITVFDAATGKTVWRQASGSQPVDRLRFDPTGELLVSGSRNGPLGVWNAATGQRLRDLGADSAGVMDLRPLPSGKFLSGSNKGSVWRWDPRTGDGTELAKISSPIVRVASNEITGIHVATVGANGVVAWRGGTTQKIWELTRLSWEPRGLDISPAGDRVFVGAANRIVVLDAATGKELLTLGGHTNVISDLMLCRAGGRIVTASQDGAFGIWDAEEPSTRREALRVSERGRREQQLFAATRLNQDFAAVFQLDRLMPTTTAGERADMLGPRGIHQAVLGRLPEALADLDEALRLGVKDHAGQVRGAALLVQIALGKSKDYRASFALGLNPLGLALMPKADLAETAAVACLAPDTVPDPKMLVRILGDARASNKGSPDYALTTFYAAALFRAGELKNARKLFGEAMALHPAGGTPWDWFFLALVDAKAGDRESAERWNERAVKWMAANGPQAIDLPGVGVDVPVEMIWIAFQILRNQAAESLR